MLHFGELVGRNGATWPESIAYTDGARTVTWRQFDRRTDALAAALKSLGVSPGARVAMLAADCIEVAELFIACAKAGAIRVGINARLAPREVAHLLDDSGAEVLVVQADYCDVAERALAQTSGTPLRIGFAGSHDSEYDFESLITARISDRPFAATPDETAMLAYTTGSTGLPKGAVYPHQAMLRSMLYIALAEGMRRDDVILHAMPARPASPSCTCCGICFTLPRPSSSGPGMRTRCWH